MFAAVWIACSVSFLLGCWWTAKAIERAEWERAAQFWDTAMNEYARRN